MEGILLKWTNYYSGWQPRWFVLNDDGTLSYYNSREETRNGCRGSVNLALCEIIVHQNDPKRLDIVIPGEQHYSLKAPTANDRSSWLRILGSTKLVGKRRASDADMADAVKTRRSEVRLYMDLILQQASEAQAALSRDVDKAAAENALAMLVTTAQVLARSIDDFFLLTSSYNPVNGASEAHLVVSPTATPTPGKLLENASFAECAVSSDASGNQVSYFNSQLGLVHCKPPQTPHGQVSNTENGALSCTETPVMRDVKLESAQTTDGLTVHCAVASSSTIALETPVISSKPSNNVGRNDGVKIGSKILYKYRSSMSELEGHTFSDVDIISQSGDMSVLAFLDAARSILVILDRFHTSVLSPVRSDVSGNISKIEAALNNINDSKIDKNKCTMQTLIQMEIDKGRATVDPSAGVGLVWLVRGLEFVSLFLKLLADPACTDARQCASEAYSRTLRSFHGIMARTVFSLALQALPVKPAQFLNSIGGADKHDIADIRQDLLHYVSGLREVLDSLNKFLDKTGLSKKL